MKYVFNLRAGVLIVDYPPATTMLDTTRGPIPIGLATDPLCTLAGKAITIDRARELLIERFADSQPEERAAHILGAR